MSDIHTIRRRGSAGLRRLLSVFATLVVAAPALAAATLMLGPGATTAQATYSAWRS